MSHSVSSNENYWDKFYKNIELSVPSQFCVMVATEVAADPCIIEFGCGNGRDSLYLAGQNHAVCALDLSHEAVKSCNDAAQKFGLDAAHFSQCDLSSADDISKAFEKARGMSKDGTIIGYS